MATQPGNLSNTAIGQGEPWGLPLGSVVSRDGQTLREMKATVAINPGDAVLLDAAGGPYNVTKSATLESQARYGLAVTAASAASQPVWICIEGPADAIAGASIGTQGMLLVTSNASAGQVQPTSASDTQTQAQLITFTATLSPAGTSGWSEQLFAASFFKNGTATLASTDRVVGIQKAAIQTDLAVPNAIITSDASAVGILFCARTSASVVPTVSENYYLTISRGLSAGSGGTAGAIIGQAQTTASGAGVRFKAFVNPA